MNKYLAIIIKRYQRAYLRARIVAERPALIGKPFIVQVRTYTMDAIEAHAKERDAFTDSSPDAVKPELPELVCRAMEVEADKSVGYYRAQMELYKHMYWEASFREGMAMSDHCLSMIETNGYREVAAEAIEQLNAIKFSTDRQN